MSDRANKQLRSRSAVAWVTLGDLGTELPSLTFIVCLFIRQSLHIKKEKYNVTGGTHSSKLRTHCEGLRTKLLLPVMTFYMSLQNYFKSVFF